MVVARRSVHADSDVDAWRDLDAAHPLRRYVGARAIIVRDVAEDGSVSLAWRARWESDEASAAALAAALASELSAHSSVE
jgi:hypothetical protein